MLSSRPLEGYMVECQLDCLSCYLCFLLNCEDAAAILEKMTSEMGNVVMPARKVALCKIAQWNWSFSHPLDDAFV